MKKLLLLLTLLSVSCNCGSSLPPSTSQPEVARPPNLSLSKREMGFELLSYIKERTVHVTKDCAPKNGIVIVVIGSAIDPTKFLDSRGSGVILNSSLSSSYIATALHVVATDKKYAETFDCKFAIALNGKLDKPLPAQLVAFDENRDLAILKVLHNLGVSTYVEYDSHFGVDITGEDIYAVGYPNLRATSSVHLSVSKGVVATVNIPFGGNATDNGYVHRVDAQFYFGSSGGGIWNLDGELVGLADFIYTHETDDTDPDIPYEGQYYIKPAYELEGVANAKKIFGIVNHE